MNVQIGALYSYTTSRTLYEDEDRESYLSSIDANEPFVVLHISKKPALIIELTIELTTNVYKVLTAKGVIGWISGVPKLFQQIKQEKNIV